MRRNRSGRSLFLLELGFLLLLFILCSVVCVSLFAFASSKNEDANDLNSAVVKGISIADTLKSCKSDLGKASGLLDADPGFSIYYDDNWMTGGARLYRATVNATEENGLLTFMITFVRLRDGKTIFCLETKEFTGEGLK